MRATRGRALPFVEPEYGLTGLRLRTAGVANRRTGGLVSILTGGTMIKNSPVEGAYPARKPRESARCTAPRLSLTSAFIVILLLSLGSWWAIWVAVSSLVSG